MQNCTFLRILSHRVFHTWFVKEFTTFVVCVAALFSQFSGQLTVTHLFWSCCTNSNCFRRDFVLHINPTDFFEIFFAFFNALSCVNSFLSLKNLRYNKYKLLFWYPRVSILSHNCPHQLENFFPNKWAIILHISLQKYFSIFSYLSAV